MGARLKSWRGLAPAIAAAAVLAWPPAVEACGWWGDGEGDDGDAEVIGPEGEAVEESLLPETREEMARLSAAYRRGEGVPREPILARLWAERAARAGHAGAMNDLAQMFETGFGGAKDEGRAVHWYREAARRGIAAAQHSLAMMLREGRGVAHDEVTAEHWLRAAARGGHGAAAAELAAFLWAGRIAAREPHEGCFWWLVALRQGEAGEAGRCLAEDPALRQTDFEALTARVARWQPAGRPETAHRKGES